MNLERRVEASVCRCQDSLSFGMRNLVRPRWVSAYPAEDVCLMKMFHDVCYMLVFLWYEEAGLQQDGLFMKMG